MAIEKLKDLVGSATNTQSFVHDPVHKELATNCTVHDDSNVIGFFEDFRFLSNFWPCNVTAYGEVFKSVDSAYQAAKYPSISVRKVFLELSPSTAKKMGKSKNLEIRPDWEHVKVSIMYNLLTQKFNSLINPELDKLLRNTGAKHLEERNYWGDMFWGTDEKGNGFNNLGRLLQCVRSHQAIESLEM